MDRTCASEDLRPEFSITAVLSTPLFPPPSPALQRHDEERRGGSIRRLFFPKFVSDFSAITPPLNSSGENTATRVDGNDARRDKRRRRGKRDPPNPLRRTG
eukprot:CAMPEP_0183299486 /NCGR_PEP_ID=MMETSP0160_2-20130417/6212_1 /TAXON_ID=2839 ORGANISM="Odontella Sinensis, Strain Grunow 1884" /NCGR_SAMPLE_ID=MMETSP0160_2 /ASSEMBLY_ACC=CAM_ASM_000250 /LENGTH=100 /DNA_ID=CAMNT_0025461741 /DNA_START=717 /DNA_END=1015 /DNA_ORIENTATION=-